MSKDFLPAPCFSHFWVVFLTKKMLQKALPPKKWEGRLTTRRLDSKEVSPFLSTSRGDTPDVKSLTYNVDASEIRCSPEVGPSAPYI